MNYSIEHVLTCIARFLLARIFFQPLKDKVSAKLIRKTLKELQINSKKKEPEITLLCQAYDNVMKRINGQPDWIQGAYQPRTILDHMCQTCNGWSGLVQTGIDNRSNGLDDGH
jgi:hypothetical protein